MFDSKDVIMLNSGSLADPKSYMTDSANRFKDMSTIRRESTQNMFGSRKTSTATIQSNQIKRS